MIEHTFQEIGSEFWDVPITEKGGLRWPSSTCWYLSGRSALCAIIRELTGVKSIAIPSWCCESMIKPFADWGLEVRFYPVYTDGGLVRDFRMDCDAVLLMDYFGCSCAGPDLSDYRGTVIRDVTHSLFSPLYQDADYYFGSLRKWCGVWTGGFAWTADGHALHMEHSDDLGYTHLREKAMKLKAEYLNGPAAEQGRGTPDKSYLRVFAEAEDCLEQIGIAPAVDRDILLAEKLDVELIKSRRRSNARILIGALPELLLFPELKAEDCPLFVPISVPDGRRDALRRYLIDREIYCPVHWPVSKYHELGEKTASIYRDELSLICDQRYTEEDMHRIVLMIKQFFARCDGA